MSEPTLNEEATINQFGLLGLLYTTNKMSHFDQVYSAFESFCMYKAFKDSMEILESHDILIKTQH